MLLIDNQNVFADDAKSLDGHHVSDEPAIYIGREKNKANGIKRLYNWNELDLND